MEDSPPSTLLNKNIDYNRLALKIVIANHDGPVKRKIKWKEKVRKETILSYNKLLSLVYLDKTRAESRYVRGVAYR